MTNNKKGFTIIEVVLVLAIAGLIFLMVFIALPALQRGQRNTRRRQDMARIMSAITDYQANNNGKLPVVNAEYSWSGGSTWQGAELDTKFPVRYIEENLSDKSDDIDIAYDGRIGRKIYTFKCQDGKSCDRFADPDGTIYRIAAAGTDLDSADDYTHDFDHIVYITAGVVCGSGGEQYVEDTNNANDSAVRYVLEGGAVYCNDNK